MVAQRQKMTHLATRDNLVLALIQQANFYNAAQARRWFAANLTYTFFPPDHPFFATLRKPCQETPLPSLHAAELR